MNATKEMKQAAWNLKMLTASDPGATANMMRHAAALEIMLTGRCQRDTPPGEPEISAAFEHELSDAEFLAAMVARTGVDRVFVTFDVDEAAGPPTGIDVVRSDGLQVDFYGGCRLWAPANDGRALLVPADEPGTRFSHRKGAALRRTEVEPSCDLEAGFRRAARRLERLVASAALRDVHRGCYAHVLSCDDGTFTTRPTRLAA